MCLYIANNVLTCHIIYFRYVDTEKRIDNSPKKKYRKLDSVLSVIVTDTSFSL